MDADVVLDEQNDDIHDGDGEEYRDRNSDNPDDANCNCMEHGITDDPDDVHREDQGA